MSYRGQEIVYFRKNTIAWRFWNYWTNGSTGLLDGQDVIAWLETLCLNPVFCCDLSGNKCGDLVLNDHPTLCFLNVSGNELKDISFCEKIPVLEYLDLSENNLSWPLNFECLRSLRNLKVLDLSHNPEIPEKFQKRFEAENILFIISEMEKTWLKQCEFCEKAAITFFLGSRQLGPSFYNLKRPIVEMIKESINSPEWIIKIENITKKQKKK